MMDIEPIKIKKVERVFDTNRELMKKNDTWIFRGHRESKWNLQTSLERTMNVYQQPMKDAPQIEAGLLRRFKRESQNYVSKLPLQSNYMEWFALMQHYGAPTRLLDWTYSFFVALFFAVEGADGECAVWAFNSDSVTGKLREILPKKDTKCLDEDPNALVADNFENMFMRRRPKALVCTMNPYNFNERLIIQQGVFLCPGDVSKPFERNLSAVFSKKELRDNLRKYEIADDTKLRKEIIQNLRRMNMSRATLFPGLDGFAQSLRDLLAFPDVLHLLPPDSDYIKTNVWTSTK